MNLMKNEQELLLTRGMKNAKSTVLFFSTKHSPILFSKSTISNEQRNVQMQDSLLNLATQKDNGQ